MNNGTRPVDLARERYSEGRRLVGALSLDWRDTGVDLARLMHRVPEETVLMGNISPTMTMLSDSSREVTWEPVRCT